MQITKEALQEKIGGLEMQERQHLHVAAQAKGAIELARYLLAELEKEEPKDHLTLAELGEAVGGTVEAIDPIP